MADIYNKYPFNHEFYTRLYGEETVNEMTNVTGETCIHSKPGCDCITQTAARALFPRVNFREVEDAEMVVAVLRNASIDMVKRVGEAIKTLRMSKIIGQMGMVAVLTDQHGKETDGHTIVAEMCTAISQMVGMVEAVTSQLAVMYGTPDEENAKYVSDLLEFVTETRAVLADIIGTNEALNTKTEAGE